MSSKKAINFATVKITDKRYQLLLDDVVIVPMTFLTLHDNGETTVNYLKPPHNTDDVDLIEGMVSMANATPPETWEPMSCKVMNGYATYKDALNHNQQPSASGSEELIKQLSTLSRLDTSVHKEQTIPGEIEEDNLKKMAVHSEKIIEETVPLVEPDSEVRMHVSEVESGFNGIISGTDHCPYQWFQFPQFPLINNDLSMETVETETIDLASLPTKSDLSELKQSLQNLFNDFKNEVKKHCKGLIAEFSKNVNEEIAKIDAKLFLLQQDVDDIKTYTSDQRAFAEDENIMTLENIVQKYNLSFPIKFQEEPKKEQ